MPTRSCPVPGTTPGRFRASRIRSRCRPGADQELSRTQSRLGVSHVNLIKVLHRFVEKSQTKPRSGRKLYSGIQRISEISTLILTSDRSRQEQQNCYVPFFKI
jgi:hypothetical protein